MPKYHRVAAADSQRQENKASLLPETGFLHGEKKCTKQWGGCWDPRGKRGHPEATIVYQWEGFSCYHLPVQDVKFHRRIKITCGENNCSPAAVRGEPEEEETCTESKGKCNPNSDHIFYWREWRLTWYCWTEFWFLTRKSEHSLWFHSQWNEVPDTMDSKRDFQNNNATVISLGRN